MIILVFIYFLQSKDEVKEAFIEFKTLVENQTGKRMKILRTHNGTEYVNKKFETSRRDLASITN